MASLDNDITNKLAEIRRHLNRLYQQILPSALWDKQLVVHLWSTLEQIEPIDEYIDRLELLLLELELLRDEAATQHHPHVERPTTGALRLALTPQQKQLKRQYKLEQQMAADKVPSFEETWEAHKSEVPVEDYAYEYTRVEADESDVVEWLEAKDLLPEEPDGENEAAYEEYEQLVGELVSQHHEEVSQELSEQAALEHLRDEMEELYDAAVDRVTSELHEQDCWRDVTLPKGTDPTQHDGLGIYWAYEEDAAEAHWGEPGKVVVRYRARIDLARVDRAGTIWANTFPRIGEDEAEVRFYVHAPIFVYSVTLYNDSALPTETIEINDWRIT